MRYLTSFMLTALLSTGALAATCPDVASITQKADKVYETEGGTNITLEGIRYSAENDDGEWTGFTPEAEETDLKAFRSAPSAPDATPPVCRYEDDADGAISLTLSN